MKIYDCFCFLNEVDLLEVRLTELDPVVDYFVIVEGTHTHKNLPKSLVFKEHEARYTRWRDKIIYIVHEQPDDIRIADKMHRSKRPDGDYWRREWLQRDAISRGIADAAPDDIIMISDLDEIPSREVIESIRRNNTQRNSVIFLEQPQYSGFMNWYVGPHDWIGTRLIEKKNLVSPQLMRLARPAGHKRAMRGTKTIDWWLRTWLDFRKTIRPRRIADAGWHFSSVGSVDEVARKAAHHIDAYAIRAETQDPRNIERLRAQKISHLGLKATGTPLYQLPKAVAADPEKYRRFLDPDFL